MTRLRRCGKHSIPVDENAGRISRDIRCLSSTRTFSWNLRSGTARVPGFPRAGRERDPAGNISAGGLAEFTFEPKHIAIDILYLRQKRFLALRKFNELLQLRTRDVHDHSHMFTRNLDNARSRGCIRPSH
jgi:hypothetical protein